MKHLYLSEPLPNDNKESDAHPSWRIGKCQHESLQVEGDFISCTRCPRRWKNYASSVKENSHSLKENIVV